MGSIAEDLKRDVEHDISSCGLCKKCLFLCPLPEAKDLDVFILNREASMERPSKEILDFAFLCVSCGACNFSCPYYQRMDKRLIYLRSKGKIPSGLKPLLHWRGPNLGLVDKTLYGVKKKLHKVHPKIAPHLDKTHYQRKDLLFYFSCYAFSPSEIPQKTLALADHLGLDYEVVAGYSSCCGWPHYLAGDFESAQSLFTDLFNLIGQVGAREVVTGCAECYQALKFIKERHAGEYRVLTTTDWIIENMEGLKLKRTDELVTFHDACQLSRFDGRPDETRKLVKKIFKLVEMESVKKDTICCGAMRQNHEKEGLIELRRRRLAEAKNTDAKVMVTECLTCYETYKDMDDEVAIKDLSEAVYDNLLKE